LKVSIIVGKGPLKEKKDIICLILEKTKTNLPKDLNHKKKLEDMKRCEKTSKNSNTS